MLLKQQFVPVVSSFCHTWPLIPFPWFQKFGSNQSKPEFTVDLRGGSVDWASKDKSSKKHVIEVQDTVDMSPYFIVVKPLCSVVLMWLFWQNVTFPPSAEDSSGYGAADPVRDRQCHQRLVPRPHRDHQHSREETSVIKTALGNFC